MTGPAKLALALFIVLLGAIGMAAGYIGHLQRSNQALALRAYNDSARADSTRRLADVLKDANRILGDSLAGVTRLVVQRTQERDDLDYSLGWERKYRVSLTARFDSLRAAKVPSAAPVATDSQGTRHASFHVEQPTFTAQLGVSLPAIGAGTLDSLIVNPRPARLALRIGCEPANGDGIRPARVTVTTPTWMSIAIDSAEQADDVCQRVAGQRTSWWRSVLNSFSPQVYVGLGLSADPFPIVRGEAPRITPAIQAGVSLFHAPLRLPWF